MKKIFSLFATGLLFTGALPAQGTIDFRNRITALTPPFDVPVYDFDGFTRLSGANFLAQVYFSPTQTGSLTAITDPPAPFRTGTGAGYWNYGTDFTRVLPGIAAGAVAWIQIRYWDSIAGATYDAARAAGGKWGDSNIFSVATGGAGSPPSIPAVLWGLQFVIPEPSTIAVGVLGTGALLLRRRK
jgi:hypothetical protein